MNPSSLSKMVIGLLVAVLVIGAGYVAIHRTSANRDVVGCVPSHQQSLTPAAQRFIEVMEGRVDGVIGGHPIEGYEPSMLRQTYPSLLASDFLCVEAHGGRYEVQGEELVFISTSDPSLRTSAEQSMTPAGMGRLLENIAKRLGVPFRTPAEVDALMDRLGPIAANDKPERTTLEGEYVCLPHRDQNGPQTLECLFGIKTQDGSYYALDLNLLSSAVPTLKTGDRIRANGLLTPVEYLSSDRWQQYLVKGIFSVTDSLEKR